MSSHSNSVPTPTFQRSLNGFRLHNTSPNPLKRSRSPNVHDDRSATSQRGETRDQDSYDKRRERLMRDLYERSERMIAQVFDPGREPRGRHKDLPAPQTPQNGSPARIAESSIPQKPKAARVIDDDYDDDEEDEEEPSDKSRPSQPALTTSDSTTLYQTPKRFQVHGYSPAKRLRLDETGSSTPAGPGKSSDEVRKKLEEDRQAAEQSAKESFLTTFYTLENDRDAMLEQQKLDELDRQVETETSASGNANSGGGHNQREQQTSLSTSNLGASSLTMKHLIAQIDARRSEVGATDAQLRNLMTEVRKNRSKWANPEKINQEELYEPAERVLMELKGMTDYATPFLQRVNKREAPDYYRVISEPMDFGTMMKKMKQRTYRNKKEFVHDLDLIWSNCLKYNADPNHFLRKKAEHMKKEAAKLTPLIPDIEVRDRGYSDNIDFDEAEESDDEKPIAASRGRKAPSMKGMKGSSSARKAPKARDDSSPAPDVKSSQTPAPFAGQASTLRNEALRSERDSTADASQHGLSTPPPRHGTPLDMNGVAESAAAGSHADASELEITRSTVNGMNMDHSESPDHEDEEYKTWKQITKKDRAKFAADRHRMFHNNKLNPDEPALLRTKAGMRRYLRQQKFLLGEDVDMVDIEDATAEEERGSGAGPALSGDFDGDDESTLPDYYDPCAGVPLLEPRLRWREDAEGQVIEHREECLRMFPSDSFTAPKSKLSETFDANMAQMQETRKVMAKIGVVKQMQLQAQTYQNQFQKYDPDPFCETGINPTVVTDEGPIMHPEVCRAALQRCVGKVFYHAGFDEFQPSAVEVITDIAKDYFTNMAKSLVGFMEKPKVPCRSTEVHSATDIPNNQGQPKPTVAAAICKGAEQPKFKPRFDPETQVLQTLANYGHDLESLHTYVEEDIPRQASKLKTHHEHVKEHLAELLRPALDPSKAGGDGAGAFIDGSEQQFVAGDFAEDIDEDFFGFKELGLDRELGLASLSVPLHLLQSRVHNAYQPANAAVTGTSTGLIMENPPPWDPITTDNVNTQVGMVQQFFKEKLEKSTEDVLVEDDELPAKQRFPKPRLPPSGKISSPRKRPLREQQQMARKKKRLEIEAGREREREATAAIEREKDAANGSGAGGVPTSQRNGESTTTDSGPTAPAENGTRDANTNETPDQPGANGKESQHLVNGESNPASNTTSDAAAHPKEITSTSPDASQHAIDTNNIPNGTSSPDPPATVLNNAVKLDPTTGNINGQSHKGSGDPEKKKEAVKSEKEKEKEDKQQGKDGGTGGSEKEREDDDAGMLSPESLPIAAH